MNRIASRLAWVAYGLTVIAGLAYLFMVGNGRTYVLDEWMWVADRREPSVDALFSPHNGNLYALPVAAYMAVFNTVGLDRPEVFRHLVLLSHLAVAVCAAELVRRRHGMHGAAAAGSVVLFLGAGADNILWGFQIGMVWSVLFLLAVVLLLDSWFRGPRTVLLVGASSALVVSVLSSSVGVCACAATAWIVVLSRERRRLWWVPVPGILAYSAWFLLFREPMMSNTDPGHIVSWVWRSMVGSLAAFLALPFAGGVVMAAAMVGLGVVALRRGSLTPSSTAWIPFLGSFWVLTGIARWFDTPTASRYLYVSMIGSALFVAGVVPSLAESVVRRRAIAAATMSAIAIVSIAVQFPQFGERDGQMRGLMFAGENMRGLLAAAEMSRGTVRGDVALVWFGKSTLMDADDYFEAIDWSGDSPAPAFDALPSASPGTRAGADRFLNISNLARVAPEAPDECDKWSDPTGAIEVPGGGSVVVGSPGSNGMIVRRFHPEDWPVITWREIPSGELVISVPKDPIDIPWTVYFSSAVRVDLCG